MAYTNFTNCTKEQYESIIYSEEDTNRIRIWFNNVELLDADEYCESFSGTNRILPDDGNKIFTLDNFIAKNYTLVLRDLPEGTIISDQVKVSIGTLVNENNNTYEDVPIGIFNIQDTPINDRGRVTIKLRDNRVKFDFNYNAQPLIESLGGTATKKQILEDICNQAGVINNVVSFEGEDDEIGIYDNTITATTYITYIFEQAGIMPYINREGQLDKIDFSDLKVWQIPLSIVEKYEKGTPFKIERVVYESGIIKYESSNDETLDTLYLNSANPYINDKQQIDNIYNLIVGFAADSVKSGRILGNPAIDPFDMILIYDDEINDNPISTATGTNLTLENTPNASTNIDLLGNTTQDTTTGKNLLGLTNVSSTTTYGITYSVNNNVITLSGTANNSGGTAVLIDIALLTTMPTSLGTLTKSLSPIGTYTGVQTSLRQQDANTSAGVWSNNGATTSGTLSGNAYWFRIQINNGTSVNCTLKAQVETGSSVSSFEPYTYGASPNPNYPQNVETITGRNTIDVCGKNLFDKDTTNYKKGYYLNASGVETSGTNWGVYYIPVKPNTSYTISGCQTNGGVQFCWFTDNKTFISAIGQKQNRTNITSPSNASYIGLSIVWNTTSSAYDGTTFMLEQNSSATTYEPYIGNSYEVNLGKNLLDEEQLLQATGWQKQNDIYSGTIDAWYSKFRYGFTGLHFKTNTQYTISLKGYTTGGTPRVQIVYTDNSSELINIYASTMTSYIKTTNASKSVSNIKVDYGTGGANILYLSQFMIEKGSTASSYSPYFEPIELCKIGNYQDRLFKASGKNLFDEKNILSATGWTYSNGYYTGTANNLRTYFNTTQMYSFKTNTRYTFSWKGYLGTATNLRIRITYTDSSTQESAYITTTSLTSSSITSQVNKTISSITINYSDGGTIFLKELQLEENTNATSYEPYGNYWYKEKNIGKLILNGTENYSNQSGEYDTTTRMMFSVNPSSIPQNMTNRKAVCNYFINYNGTVQNRNVDVTAFNFNNSPQYSNFMYFKLEKSVLPTQDATGFKNWVASHNLIIYYQIATPTYERITNDELIEQLNRLKTIQTVESTTNIQQDSSSSPFELNIEYFNESYILKTLANNTYKYTGINRNEFNTEISLEQRKENVSIKSEATYQKIAKTEIDAANASISMITGELGFVDGESQVINGIIQYQDKNSAIIQAISSSDTTTDENGNIVPTGVKTSTGFTFDKDGLKIQKSDSTYNSLHNERGEYYFDGTTPLGETTPDGSKFKNMDIYGEFRYGKDEINETAMFVGMLFKDTIIRNGQEVTEECFGHFFNGRENE